MSYGNAFLRFGTHAGLTGVQILSIRERKKSIISQEVVNDDGLPQSEHYAGTRTDLEIRLRVKSTHTKKAPASLITLTGDFAGDYVVDEPTDSREAGNFREVSYMAHKNSSMDYSSTYTDPV